MPDDEGNQTQEESEQREQASAAMRAAREAADRNKAAAQSARQEAATARAELAEMKAQVRHSDLRSVLGAIGVPEGLAAVYPSDQEVSEEAVRNWATQELGVNPVSQAPSDRNIEGWERISRIQEGVTPLAPAVTELDEYVNKANKDLEKMVFWFSNPEEFGPGGESWRQFKRLEREATPDIMSGRIPSVITPEGWGGLASPPEWAQTWRNSSGAL